MYSNITGNPKLAEAIAQGRVYKEYPDGDYVEVEPEDEEMENES